MTAAEDHDELLELLRAERDPRPAIYRQRRAHERTRTAEQLARALAALDSPDGRRW